LDVNGVSIFTGTGGFAGLLPSQMAGGIFAQPSNIGRQNRDEFAVVPALELKLSYAFTSHLRAFVGYDFLYWSRVARPGDQINQTLNLPAGGPALLYLPMAGPGARTQPSSQFNSTDFWAQGFTIGLDVGW
jgi:hypothetical protein